MNNSRLMTVLNAIDDINKEDPNMTLVNGENIAKELVYGQRMTTCINHHWPDANEYLQIAVRAQHIKRWHLKRNEFEAGRTGYLTWRKELGKFHAQLTATLMLENGYREEESEKTAAIIRKEKIKSNPDSQTLEDVACLVFLQYYFEEFAAKYQEEKIIDIVQKTWKKMSEKGHSIALSLSFPEHLSILVNKALS